IGLILAAPFALAIPFAPSPGLAVGALAIAELFAFMNTGPLNTALMNAVSPSVRETASGLNILCIHLLGDALSPPLLGALATHLGGPEPGPHALGLAVAAVAAPMLIAGIVLIPMRRPMNQRSP